MKVIKPAGVTTGELHVHQLAQHRGRVDGRPVGLQQIVDRDWRDRHRKNRQGLHHLLGQRVQPLERRSDQPLDHIPG